LAENRNSDAAVVEVQVSSEQLAVVAARTGARPDEAALLALARAVAQWTDADAALIDVLGHGRRLPIGVDVSRSVGMFITYSPVVLAGTGGKIDSSLERLRSDLENGWTFDALRLYGPPEVRATMDELPRADVLFNYVGRAIATDDDGILVATDEARGLETDPSGRRDHLLAVRADLLDDDGLKLVFVYSTALHAAATIQGLAQRTVDCLNDLGSRPT
jgi:non-ribosomal peptide synthase protein (TIGR01720 family)